MSDYMKKNAKLIEEVAAAEGIDFKVGETGEKSGEEKQSMKERVAEIVTKLEQGLKEVFESDNYKNYLNTMAKFHNYSINNTLLINQQMPEATLVAGFNAWANNFDRHVKKGEKGIKIIAPAPYTIKKEQPVVDPKTGEAVRNFDGTPKTTEVEVKVPAFKVTTVFDISQTYGKELPTLGVSELNEGVDKAKDFIESLKRISPVPIEFGETSGESKGFYNVNDKSITIKEGMSDAQTIKTMVHEISHAKLHDPEIMKENDESKSRGTKEMEAESVAYIVCQHFGIDTSDYSFGYIAGWSEGKEMGELKESMNTIRETSSEMINRIEGNLRALEHDREAHMEANLETVNPTVEEAKETKAEVKESDKGQVKSETKEENAKKPVEKEADSSKRKSLKEKLSEKKKEVKKEPKKNEPVKKKGKEI